ncbi:hypothetical protein BCR36DRAFT_413804 [Piromyces finnis]|uniref:Uncharacterized protein n=1 Tax=Piromyces finnis TaxID=1754191 RepID=A0A1Y1V623_9FUNG|nr:hypothetical protein BCR36DRAFT_413804 [Piromyces finnis]|eukprot:ORX46853.1 hypothetical protein BCR36DRAFT_413804 [Piromyces finnis]
MKIISQIIFISSIISAVLAAPFNSNNGSSGRFTEACKAEMIAIEGCISQKISKENLSSVCATSQSTQCQQFYFNPMSFLPSCQSVKSLITVSAEIFKNTLSIMCETSETGEICPFTDYEITTGLANTMNVYKNNPMAEMQMNEAALNSIKNSCSSPKCTEATKKYIQFLLDSNNSVTQAIAANYKFSALPNANKEVVDKLKSFLDILDGPNCLSNISSGVIPQSLPGNNVLPAETADNTIIQSNNTLLINNDLQAPQKLNNDEGSFALTRYTIMSFILYMVLYCGLFKYILL